MSLSLVSCPYGDSLFISVLYLVLFDTSVTLKTFRIKFSGVETYRKGHRDWVWLWLRVEGFSSSLEGIRFYLQLRGPWDLDLGCLGPFKGKGTGWKEEEPSSEKNKQTGSFFTFPNTLDQWRYWIFQPYNHCIREMSTGERRKQIWGSADPRFLWNQPLMKPHALSPGTSLYLRNRE